MIKAEAIASDAGGQVLFKAGTAATTFKDCMDRLTRAVLHEADYAFDSDNWATIKVKIVREGMSARDKVVELPGKFPWRGDGK